MIQTILLGSLLVFDLKYTLDCLEIYMALCFSSTFLEIDLYMIQWVERVDDTPCLGPFALFLCGLRLELSWTWVVLGPWCVLDLLWHIVSQHIFHDTSFNLVVSPKVEVDSFWRYLIDANGTLKGALVVLWLGVDYAWLGGHKRSFHCLGGCGSLH